MRATDQEIEEGYAAMSHMRRMPTLEEELLELNGPRCPDFEPGCPCCDTWEMWDLHAYGALRAHLDEIYDYLDEGSYEHFNRYITGDR